jgi:putative restriction endonuclease
VEEQFGKQPAAVRRIVKHIDKARELFGRYVPKLKLAPAPTTFPHLPGRTEQKALQKARNGQGIFKKRVRSIEPCCRVTEVDDLDHLIASHIKPWRGSTSDERLDGNNGLLLAPHVDRLFDHGYISFTNSGRLLISKEMNREVLRKWHIDPKTQRAPFNAKQSEYLKYHREKVFKH